MYTSRIVPARFPRDLIQMDTFRWRVVTGQAAPQLLQWPAHKPWCVSNRVDTLVRVRADAEDSAFRQTPPRTNLILNCAPTKGGSAYSILVALADGQVDALYEEDGYRTISLAAFDLSWLKGE